MKFLLILSLCILATLSAGAQSLSLFDVDTANFPIMKAKFYAFDAAGNQVRPSLGELTLTENSTPRTITSVTCPPPPPPVAISSVLTVDVSGSMSSGSRIDLAKAAARAWIQGLPSGQSECALSSFDDKNYLNQDFTSDRSRLMNALSTLTPRGGTNYDMGLLQPLAGSLQVSQRGQYKRVVIFLSDGMPNSPPQTAAIIAEANKQNCMVFAVTLGMPCPQSLKDIASQTGGQWYENVTTATEAENVYLEILQTTIGGFPCDITWQSGTACQSGKTTIELSWMGHKTSAQYFTPTQSVASLSFSPSFIFCKSKPIGISFDTIVTVKANNKSFNITNIVSSNPIFDINPKTFSLNIGQSQVLTISYTPADSGYAWTKFDVQTDICPQTFSTAGGFPGKKPTKKTLKLTHPNGGEVFVVGSDTVITWEGIPTTDTVTLEFSKDNGTIWQTIANAATGLRYNWNNIPKPPSNQCLIRVRQPDWQANYEANNPVPPIEWQKTLGGKADDFATSIQLTLDVGYVVTGYSHSSNGDVTRNQGASDLWVVKLDAGGNIVWQKTVGGSNLDYATSIQPTLDGGYVAAGYTRSNDGDVTRNQGASDLWVVKLDAGGSMVWQKTLGGSNGDYAYSIQPTLDGGYVVAGFTNSNDSDVTGNHGNNDFWVVKLDTDGNMVWQKTLGGSREDFVRSIQPTLDGGYVTAGNTNSNDGDFTGNHGGSDFWIVKLDMGGNMIWQKTLGGSGEDYAHSIQPTLDSGYVMAGTTTSNDVDVTGNHGDRDFWVVKLDSDGNKLWQKTLGGSNDDDAKSILSTLDGGYVVTGYTRSNDGGVTGNHGDIGLWVVKLDAGGNIVWQKTLGGNNDDAASSIQQTLDGGYVVTGYTRSNDGDVTGNHGGYDFWVVKLEPDRDNALQTDTSNSTFSIVMPQPAAQDIDMGRVLVGSVKDSVVVGVIRNTGSYRFRVDSIGFSGNQAPEFRLVSGFPPFVVQPNDSARVEFRFVPATVGQRQAQLLIFTQGDSTLQQTIRGEGVQPQLAVVNSVIDFGKVLVGTNRDTLQAVTIHNVGSAPLSITNTKHAGPNDKDFSTLAGGGTFTLNPNDTARLDLRYMPSDVGRTTGRLQFDYNGVGSPAEVILFAEGFRPDSGRITLVAGTASAFPGEHITIPITLELPTNTTLSNVTGFDVTLRYNSTLLFPADNSMTITSSGNEALLTFFAPYNPAGGELLAVPFIATLGNDTTTVVKIEKAVLRISSGNVDIATRDGSFALKGVCYAGGAARLYKPSGKAMLMAVHPNPAEDEAEIEYETSETGVTSLKIFNALGIEVAVPASTEMNAGFHVAKVRTSEFSAGTYFIIMTTPTERHVARFEVVR